MLTIHQNDILEDLLVTMTDGISSMYLELISVDGNLSSEIAAQGLSLCSLSTRVLQKLRNEVNQQYNIVFVSLIMKSSIMFFAEYELIPSLLCQNSNHRELKTNKMCLYSF